MKRETALYIFVTLNAIATVLFIAWGLIVLLYWGIALYDTNFEAMQALNAQQRAGIFSGVRGFLIEAIVPLIITNVLWLLLVPILIVNTKQGVRPATPA